MNGHHLILGQLTDCITGQNLEDTHDERYRQHIAGLLLQQKGYHKSQITPRHPLVVKVDDKCARILVSFTICLTDRITMLIQYGPGSLVTRHRPALAMARLVADYQVPVVVVTNGEQADILDGGTGKTIAMELKNIPTRSELSVTAQNSSWKSIQPHQADMAARIVMAFEVDDRCPCDDSICTLNPS